MTAAVGVAGTATVLFDDADLRIVHHRCAMPADVVVVTFDTILLQPPQPPFAVDFLLRAGADVVSVRKHREHFFQPLDRDRFDAVVGPVIAGYRRRLAYGSSLGGYAVLYYCRDGYDRVIASSPRVSAHPIYGIARWQRQTPFRHTPFDAARPATSPAIVFYDPLDRQDRRFIEEGIRPGWPRAEHVRLPYAGHPANRFLAEVGFIAPFVRALVRDIEPPRLDRRTGKARSGMYHQELAAACLRHGKPRWALALTRRAAELNPQLASVLKVQAEVAIAQGDFVAAKRLLRQAAERLPDDEGCRIMLRRLPWLKLRHALHRCWRR